MPWETWLAPGAAPACGGPQRTRLQASPPPHWLQALQSGCRAVSWSQVPQAGRALRNQQQMLLQNLPRVTLLPK